MCGEWGKRGSSQHNRAVSLSALCAWPSWLSAHACWFPGAHPCREALLHGIHAGSLSSAGAPSAWQDLSTCPACCHRGRDHWSQSALWTSGFFPSRAASPRAVVGATCGWCHVGCQLCSLLEHSMLAFQIGFLRLHSGLLPFESEVSLKGRGVWTNAICLQHSSKTGLMVPHCDVLIA